MGDHVPPTNLPEDFKDLLRDAYPEMSAGTDLTDYTARPQCSKWSHQQGGRMSRIKAALSRAADTLGMPNYWRS